MKSLMIVGILSATIFVFSPQTQFPNLEGPYLGRKAPGTTPERFMTSVHRIHSAPAFSPDLKEVYWSVFPATDEFSTRTQVILYSKREKGKWTAPKLADFSGRYFDGGPVFGGDGKKLYFYSRRPLNENSRNETDGEIWYVEKMGKAWSDPRHLPIPINGDKLFFSLDEQGSIYFTSGHGPKGVGSGTVDIFLSRFSNGTYVTPERLSGRINTDRYIESDALISPDESYLVFYSFERPGNIGQYDLYVSFRTDNRWSVPLNLGEEINQGYSRFPGLSPDGKYLFFVRRDGVYWVSTKIFEKLSSESRIKKNEQAEVRSHVIAVPEGTGNRVITDGTFADGEWDDALRVAMADRYSLHFKADSEALYVGLKSAKPIGELVCEIRLTPDEKEVFLLHVSGALGEGSSGFPATTKFELNNNRLWQANFLQADAEKEAAWVAAGRPLDKYDDIYPKRDGIEFKIDRKKLGSNSIKFTIGWVRVEVEGKRIDKRTYNYPENAGLESADGWAELVLPAQKGR